LYVLAIAPKSQRKKIISLKQIFVAERPIQETQFKRKKEGVERLGFFCYALPFKPTHGRQLIFM